MIKRQEYKYPTLRSVKPGYVTRYIKNCEQKDTIIIAINVSIKYFLFPIIKVTAPVMLLYTTKNKKADIGIPR